MADCRAVSAKCKKVHGVYFMNI